MAAPEWTKDEKALEEAKEYLRKGNTVDFFEQVASTVLKNHPADLLAFCTKLVADLKAGQAPQQEGEFQPKKEEDNKYMRTHNVSEFLDKWILALLDKRPESDADRLEFHEAYLAQLVSEKSNA
jgi:hypothetical protein